MAVSILGLVLMSSLLIRAYGYNILIIFPTPSYSHQQPIMVLTEALVKRGHQIFAVTPNAVPGLDKNYTHVDMSFSYKYKKSDLSKNVDDREVLNLQKQISIWEFLTNFHVLASIPGHQFRSEQFKQFERQVKEEGILFDLIIGEAHFTPYICGMGRHLAAGTPIIALSTLPKDWYTEGLIGSFDHYSYEPAFGSPFTDRMSLRQKIINWIVGVYLIPLSKSIVENSARSYFQESYGVEYGSLVDGCWSNVSLTMVTSNCITYYPRLLGPNIIELGPLHIKPRQKLPEILQEWMDGTEKGVIYFSLGNNFRGTSLPEDVRSNFLRVFRELPPGYRVLWKWESDEPVPGQSDNVLTQKWMPQQSVLAHPKIKLFITQGGLQSFQEAVHYGVPLVGIPFFGDQEGNVMKMEAAGIGVQLLPQDLHSHDAIQSAVYKVLHEESFMVNMRRLSAISRDFTPHAVDKAVFWVEHVAKHGGASHLRPSTADTTYFQYICLDIISVILALSLVVLYIFISICKCIVPVVFPLHKSKIKLH